MLNNLVHTMKKLHNIIYNNKLSTMSFIQCDIEFFTFCRPYDDSFMSKL